MCPQPENSIRSSPSESASAASEFSSEERRTLLQLAHESIAAALEHRLIPLDSPSVHLAEPRGVFTTLYSQGQLRGCVGYIFALEPVYRTVAETARCAAFEDTRFWPVTPAEAPGLEVHLSILSSLFPIIADEVEIGRHGLLVSHSGRRGLLLPQVASEHHWDRDTFLEQTCRKAGLPPDCLRRGATLEAFTAETFGDADFK